MSSPPSDPAPEHPLAPLPLGGNGSTRGRIIDAALRQIDEDPDARLDLERTAALAGLTPAELLLEFPDESTLVPAILSYLDAHWGERTFLGDHARGWPGLKNSENFLLNSAGSRNVARFFMRTQADAVEPNHPAHDWLMNNHELAAKLGNFTFKSGQQDGTVSEDLDVELAPVALNALVNGLRLYWLATGDKQRMVEAMRFVSDAVEAQYGIPPQDSRQDAPEA